MTNLMLWADGEGGEGGNAFMGGAAPGSQGAGDAGGAGAGDGDGDGGVQYQYPSGLDESFHGNPHLLKFANEDGSFDIAKLMKSSIHAQAQVGADKMLVPNKNFTEDQWRETFKKLGVPESVDEYQIENKLAEGQTANEEMFNQFKELAHKTGILPNQAQAVLDFYNEQMAGAAEGQAKANQEYVEGEIGKLKKEWGDSFEDRLVACDAALRHIVDDEEQLKEITESGFLNNAAVAKMFFKLAEGLQEDKFDAQTQGSFGMDKDQLQSRVTELSQEMLTMGKHHPNYVAKQKEYMKVLNQLHGSQPVSTGSGQRV